MSNPIKELESWEAASVIKGKDVIEDMGIVKVGVSVAA